MIAWTTLALRTSRNSSYRTGHEHQYASVNISASSYMFTRPWVSCPERLKRSSTSTCISTNHSIKTLQRICSACNSQLTFACAMTQDGIPRHNGSSQHLNAIPSPNVFNSEAPSLTEGLSADPPPDGDSNAWLQPRASPVSCGIAGGCLLITATSILPSYFSKKRAMVVGLARIFAGWDHFAGRLLPTSAKNRLWLACASDWLHHNCHSSNSKGCHLAAAQNAWKTGTISSPLSLKETSNLTTFSISPPSLCSRGSTSHSFSSSNTPGNMARPHRLKVVMTSLH
nr:hypothetical protein CFP56_01446 [Quercus suber]